LAEVYADSGNADSLSIDLSLLGSTGFGPSEVFTGESLDVAIIQFIPIIVGGIQVGVRIVRTLTAVTNSALKQFGRSVDDLSGSASQPFKNTGLTKAARALDKHAAGQRSSGTFPSLSGNAAARNKQAQQIVDDILGNSKSEFKTLGRGGLQVRSPSGQGIRFNKDGSFSGFID